MGNGFKSSKKHRVYKSVQLSNSSAGAYAYLLINLLEQGKREDALEQYEKALKGHRSRGFLEDWEAESDVLKVFLRSEDVKSINGRVPNN